MPNTTVRAAAEGMPEINRRDFIGTAAIAMAATTVATVEAASAGTSQVSRLIAAHRAAYAAFELECERNEKAGYAYFGQFRSSKELYVPLSIGGGQSFHYGTTRCHDEVEGVRADIKARYAGAISHTRPVEKLAPELAAEAKAKLKRALKADLRRVSKVVREEEGKRRAAGLEAAQHAYEVASNAERTALLALAEYRCTTIEETRERAAYLVSIAGPQDVQQETYEAVLRSMLPEALS